MLKLKTFSSPIIEKPADLVLWQNELLYLARLYLQKEVTAHQISKVVVYPYSSTCLISRKQLTEIIESNDYSVVINETILKKERDGIPIKELPQINNSFLHHNNIMSLLCLFRNLFINRPIPCFFEKNELPSDYILKSIEYTGHLFKSAFSEISENCSIHVSESSSRQVINNFFGKYDGFSEPIQALLREDNLTKCLLDLFCHRAYEEIFQKFPNAEDFKEYKSEKIKEMPAALEIMQKWNLTSTELEKVIFPRLRTLFKLVNMPL